ncbi:MAG: hypothetical protein QOD84_1126 [Acidobacteriaceae bacterium]
MPRTNKTARPEWSRKIEALRHRLNLSQGDIGERVGLSAMAVSRWERGAAEPDGGAYISLGNLAGDPLCWYFWLRAGLSSEDIKRVLPEANRRLARNSATPLRVVHAGAGKSTNKGPGFVALPLLPVYASTPGYENREAADLGQTLPERLIPVAIDWCPNPSSTICMRVKGNSMSPLILDDYIIAVDTSQARHDELINQIVVAQNLDKGLLVSRLIRFDHTDALISDQRENDTASLALGSGWRIVGKVLWWMGQAR